MDDAAVVNSCVWEAANVLTHHTPPARDFCRRHRAVVVRNTAGNKEGQHPDQPPSKDAPASPSGSEPAQQATNGNGVAKKLNLSAARRGFSRSLYNQRGSLAHHQSAM